MVFSTSAASSSSSSRLDLPEFATMDSSMDTPWDRMRAAKMALLAQEDHDAAMRRALRRSRRESSTGASSVGEESYAPSVASWDLSSISSSHPTSPTPIGILRRSSYGFPAPRHSATSLDSRLSLASSMSRTSSGGPMPLSLFETRDSVDSVAHPPFRRQSSVRFSDDSDSTRSSGDRIVLRSSPATSRPVRSPEVDGLREDIARSSRALKLDLNAMQRSSAISLLSTTADPCTFTSPLSRLSHPESSDFSRQPLPYPRLSRQASRLSSCSYGDTSVDESDSSIASSASNMAPLRYALDQPSLGSSPRHSVITSSASSMRDSIGSVASTMLSNDGSAVFGLPQGSAYHALLPSTRASVAVNRVPTINREEWKGDNGLSPRSGPSPTVENDSTVPSAPDVDIPMDGMISPLEINDPFDKICISDTHFAPASTSVRDSVDMLPVIEEPAKILGLALRKVKAHQRSESALSDVLNFPIPPSRAIVEMDFSPLPSPRFEVRQDPMEEMIPSEDAESGASEICLDTPRPPDRYVSTFPPQPDIGSMPGSPTLSQIMELTRRKSSWDEEPELLNSPILEAAVSHGIISPVSRKLSKSHTKVLRRKPARSLKTAESTHKTPSVEGWSGSESEEEGFTLAIQRIASRRTARTRLRPAQPDMLGEASMGRSELADPSRPLVRPWAERLSQLSNSTGSSTDSAGPLTPDVDLGDATVPERKRTPSIVSSGSGSSSPGDYPWGGSAPPSPSGSIRLGKTGKPQMSFFEDLNAELARLDKKKEKRERKEKKSRKQLPKPSRQIEGWGEPEVLLDDKWDGDVAHVTQWRNATHNEFFTFAKSRRERSKDKILYEEDGGITPKAKTVVRMEQAGDGLCLDFQPYSP